MPSENEGPRRRGLVALLTCALLTACTGNTAGGSGNAEPEAARSAPAAPGIAPVPGAPSGAPGRGAAPPAAAPTNAPPPVAPYVPVPAVGYDVSWPQCPKGLGIPERRTLGLPMPKEDAEFVVIGLTNGPAFTPNPCLREQVEHAQGRNLWTAAYAIVTYPTPEQLRTHGGTGNLKEQLRSVGRAQARENVARIKAAGLRTPIVWVDVEPSTVRPWPEDPAANNALVDGVIEGYQEAGYRVGVYSYKNGWDEITGGRQIPELPAWVPTGKRTQAEALEGCQKEAFNGGRVAIGQSTDQVYDYNYSCPGVTGSPGHPTGLLEWEKWFSR